MYLQTAIEAAQIGGRILLENLSGEKRRQISEKQKDDFVTQVDLLSENRIIEYIRRQHPDHDILAEESGIQNMSSEFQWIIDPLDGTKNYIHGFPFFSVSVALKHKDEIIVGAILEPLRNELFHAEKGRGAFLNDKPIRVSKTEGMKSSLIATGFPFRLKHLAEPYFKAFVDVFYQVSDLRRAGSAALDLAHVACGRLDGFWEIGLNLWDIAAGVLLIEEAGGIVTDIHGKNDYLQTGHILTSNPLIHPPFLNLIHGQFKNVIP